MPVPQTKLPAPATKLPVGKLPVPNKPGVTSRLQLAAVKQVKAPGAGPKIGQAEKKKIVSGITKGAGAVGPKTPFSVPGASLPPRKFPPPKISSLPQAPSSKLSGPPLRTRLPGPPSGQPRQTPSQAATKKLMLKKPATKPTETPVQTIVLAAKTHTDLLPPIDKVPTGPISAPELEIFNAIYRVYLRRLVERDGDTRLELDEKLSYFRGKYPKYFDFLCECGRCPWSKDEKSFVTTYKSTSVTSQTENIALLLQNIDMTATA